MTVVLEGMSPAQEQGWLVLLDLFPNRRTDWTLIGGQMMYILAAENGVTMPRTTTDMDVCHQRGRIPWSHPGSRLPAAATRLRVWRRQSRGYRRPLHAEFRDAAKVFSPAIGTYCYRVGNE
jgi:hypothetical protein